mmetsp:Transcript_3264/g.4731  ORF Transcript_3264/g.4731 Transcript_3264/m.4731 type:complete len:269 (-) Transcript_3264:2942-3748(-)
MLSTSEYCWRAPEELNSTMFPICTVDLSLAQISANGCSFSLPFAAPSCFVLSFCLAVPSFLAAFSGVEVRSSSCPARWTATASAGFQASGAVSTNRTRSSVWCSSMALSLPARRRVSRYVLNPRVSLPTGSSVTCSFFGFSESTCAQPRQTKFTCPPPPLVGGGDPPEPGSGSTVPQKFWNQGRSWTGPWPSLSAGLPRPPRRDRTAAMTSSGLNGGTEVAQPVPMPEQPLTRTVGMTGKKFSGSIVWPSSSLCRRTWSSASGNRSRA